MRDSPPHAIPPEAEDFLLNQASPSTAAVYRREIAKLVAFLGKPLEEVTGRDLMAYRRTFQGLRPATICRKLSTVRSLFRFLAEGGYREGNPAQVLKLPKAAQLSPYRILTPPELRRLLDQTDPTTTVGVRDRAILMMLSVNGLRESELTQIDKEDLSRRDGYDVAVIRGKGSKVRVTKIAGAVAEALDRWLAIHVSPIGPLFVATKGGRVTGRRLSTRSVRYRVRHYAREAGITRKVSPHALRHAAITHSLANGASILKVKEMAGHASLNTTQRYLHDLDALADNAVDYNPLTRSEAT
jgi:site-specific recombinase XerD